MTFRQATDTIAAFALIFHVLTFVVAVIGVVLCRHNGARLLLGAATVTSLLGFAGSFLFGAVTRDGIGAGYVALSFVLQLLGFATFVLMVVAIIVAGRAATRPAQPANPWQAAGPWPTPPPWQGGSSDPS